MKDGKTLDFRDVSVQLKNNESVIALFNGRCVIIAQFQAEDVLEWREIPDAAMRNETSATVSA